jgi:hypothetical protein
VKNWKQQHFQFSRAIAHRFANYPRKKKKRLVKKIDQQIHRDHAVRNHVEEAEEKTCILP